ncbi:MAG: phosphatidate cytidylyltransferase [Chloroflexota bacterium]|nr:phosphatidate cytidylyltransferase [Chloroflexota bacterium]
MRVRAASSVGVVVIGLAPALAGGPLFALLMAVLGVLAYHEYRSLGIRLVGPRVVAISGYAAAAAFAFAPLLDEGNLLVVAVAAGAIAVPLIGALFDPTGTDAFQSWALAAAGSLYVGLPLYGAVALRSFQGDIDAPWLTRAAEGASLGLPAAPRGLAWILIAILAVWLGDTAAYLAGRSWGRRPLLPRVSPKKTVEGALAGLLGSTLVGALGVRWFGLDVPWVAGAAIGLLLGAVGQVGDLAESLLKRQAGVKDSGDLIPGHGGILDRIDALLFALPTAWFLAELIDRHG